jgi:FecR protein
MITRIKKIFFTCCLTLPIVCFLGIFPVLVATVMSAGLVMEKNYTPGLGRPVGFVQQVQGDVVIMHSEVQKGYKAARGLRLYKGDTIRTLENGRIRFKLNDGSILSLASETKLKLTKSVYNKKKKRRSSFFQMALGKARFLVVKVLNFKRSEFKVKTPTAVCGVRGSDFILEATKTETIATALVDTELEYQGLGFLEEPPVILNDFESSTSREGQRPTTPMKLPQDKIEDLKELFIGVAPETGSLTDEDVMSQGAMDDDTGVDKVGDLGGKMNLEDIRPDDMDNRMGYDDFEKQIKPWTPSEIDTIKESVTEEGIGGELPEFPQLPQ